MFKKIISYVLSTALIFESSMVWGQKAANPPHILFDSAKEYMQDTGLNKKDITFGDWFKKSKKYLDPEVGGKIQRWVKKNANHKMPTFEIVRGKKTDDKVVLTVIARQDGKSLAMEVVQTGSEVYFIIKGRKFTHSELYHGSVLDKVFGYTPFLSAHRVKALAKSHPRTATKYFNAFRDFYTSYEKYQDVFLNNTSGRKVSVWESILPFSYAAGSTTSCIIAGWPVGQWNPANGACKYSGTEGPFANENCPSPQKNYFQCNQVLFGETCVARSTPKEEVSARCRADSNGDIKTLTRNIYDDDNYTNLTSEASGRINEVLNTCLGASGSNPSRTKIEQAFESDERALDREKDLADLESHLQSDLGKHIEKKCKGKSDDCNAHNRIACTETINRIVELLHARNKVAKTDPCEKEGKDNYTIICGGKEVSGCKTPGQNPPTCPGSPAGINITGGSTGETTPGGEVADTPEAKLPDDTTNPAQTGESSGGWFSDNWKWLVAGLVGFGAGFLVCRFWLCKDAITKTNTEYVPVPGPTRYVPVPGPIQYFVPPEVPPPITNVPEETEIPREDGQGALDQR